MKTKLKLNDLKITSFVTELKQNETLTVQGGIVTPNGNPIDLVGNGYDSLIIRVCEFEEFKRTNAEYIPTPRDANRPGGCQ